MRICYLILADHKPQQLARLIARLDGPDVVFVVHVDAGRDLATFAKAIEPTRGRLHFLERREADRPGGFATTQATLNALDHAARSEPSDYYILLSEADYPIRTDRELRDELDSGAIYAEVRAIDATRPDELQRLEYPYRPTGREGGLADRLVNELILGGLSKRDVGKALGGRQAYFGSPWWALPDEAARAVLDFCRRETRLVDFFRATRHPEEMFFQTVIAALPRGRQVRPPLTFVHTARAEAEGTRSVVLGSADLPVIEDSGRFFAHEFDLERDASVLDLIDQRLLEIEE